MEKNTGQEALRNEVVMSRILAISRGVSRAMFRGIYGRDVYEEPAISFMPVVKAALLSQSGSKRILDAACGFNNDFLSKIVESGELSTEDIVGADIDPLVKSRNKLAKRFIIQDIHEPIGSHEFDAIISLYTWEHLRDPQKVLSNFHDTLKEGGEVVIIAPMRYYYVSFIERALPSAAKNLAWRILKGKDKMPYPAYFRLCTKRSLSKAAEKSGFRLITFETLDTPPLWFMAIPPVFLLACGIMSIMNAVPQLSELRSVFVALLVKNS